MHEIVGRTSERHQLIFNRLPHTQALETLAARALAEGRFVDAFRLADRRCRVEPPALAHCFVLRAEAAYRMGHAHPAIADLETALEIAPADTAALCRLLAWGDASQRSRAASNLIAEVQDLGTLRTAIAELARAGQCRLAAATVFDDVVRGWAVWDTDESAALSLWSEEGQVSFLLAPDSFHPLSDGPVRAAAFRIPRPVSASPGTISIELQGETFFTQTISPNSKRRIAPPRPQAAQGRSQCSVIVPVYADFVATKACIDGLLADNVSGESYRIVVIDDASPDPDICAYLKLLAEETHVQLLTNARNLGFVGSVNRALSVCTEGDVLLLNADTLVPPGFVDRLAAAAAQSHDIGIVVPLSNNSGISDFPIPNQNNPIGTQQGVNQLDNVAADCNRGIIVDLPNGTGFCLYIKRACLQAIGSLSERFHRGYLEDVDFCLRAREQGFRSVCAPSVYVGHAGSRSFKGEKRSLVVRNLDVLDSRFPRFRGECAAFAAIDPLRTSRQNIEMQLPGSARPVLLVTGPGVLTAVARERAHQLAGKESRAILMQVIADDGQGTILLSASDHGPPQSLRFALSQASDAAALEEYLRNIRPSHCEIIDLAGTPALLVQIFNRINLSFDLWIADGTIARTPLRSAQGSNPGVAQRDAELQNIVAAARQILVANDAAAGFVKRYLPGSKIRLLRSAKTRSADFALQPAPPGQPHLAILPTRSSATEFNTIRAIARQFRRRKLTTPIIVIGTTLDDQRLMSFDNVFVTGPTAASELYYSLQAHHVGWILTAFDEPLFGHPIIETVLGSTRPAAYVDWSHGEAARRPEDLALAPGLQSEQVANEVASWIRPA